MPAAAIKLAMGQMGEELLLTGKKILPKKFTMRGIPFYMRTWKRPWPM